MNYEPPAKSSVERPAPRARPAPGTRLEGVSEDEGRQRGRRILLGERGHRRMAVSSGWALGVHWSGVGGEVGAGGYWRIASCC